MGNTNENTIKEVDTLHAKIIPESVSDRIYNSIVRIEIEKSTGTGFFAKLNIKNKIINCLLTCYHVINQNYVDQNKTFYIYYGKKNNETRKEILLDDHIRFIKCFVDPVDVTIIEIINTDKISEDKYLLTDLNYKQGYNLYLNKDTCLSGYPNNFPFFGERHISSGKITRIINLEFEHSIDSRKGSSGGPICLIDSTYVIGIHKSGNISRNINKGTFIGYIIDKLESDNNSDLFVEINPFEILEITRDEYQKEKEKYLNLYNYYNDIKESNRDRYKFLALFILSHEDLYESEGDIFKIKKDHFYYTITNNVNKLNQFLKDNELMLFDIDKNSRSLLHLSVLANNYETTQYLLSKGLYINEVGGNINWETPLYYAVGRVANLLKDEKGMTWFQFNSNKNFGRVFHSNINLINYIFKVFSKKKLVDKIVDIKINNKIIGKRIFKKKTDIIKNIHLDINDYEKFYHGTKYSSIESILRTGLKKTIPSKGHIPLNIKFNNIENWANSIFVSPSIFYAADFSDIIISEKKAWYIIIEGKIRKDAFTSHEITLPYYKFKDGEPRNLEYRVKEEQDLLYKGEQIMTLDSILFAKSKYLKKINNYKAGDIFNN